MEKTVHAITNAFTAELGSDLESAYLYGSAAHRSVYDRNESDINLLLVVSENVSIHQVRDIFRPLWLEHGSLLRRAPLVATRRSLTRQMHLRPVFAHHLANESRSLLGERSLIHKLPVLPKLAPQDTYAFLSHEAMLASGALAADTWSPEDAESQRRRLRRAARRILREPVDPAETAVELYGRIQDALDPKVAELPTNQPWESNYTATSPMIPGLQATYTRDLDKIVLVFNHLRSLQIQAIAWDRLGQRLARDYQGMFTTSSRQMRLIHLFETPLDLDFRRSKRTWGVDPLGDLSADRWHKMRHAARRPSDIEIDELPHAYLTQDDDQIHTIIHDFQNKLLNIQLESELLNRMGIAERFQAPTPLPGRETPPQERIDALFQHLRWWASHYARQMLQARV